MPDQISFDGAVVVITGAGNGVGRAYAHAFAQRGARVVVNDLGGSTDGIGGSDAAASRVVDEIVAAGGEAVASFDSVATPEGGQAITDRALEAFGRVDAIIANAGILRDKSVVKLDTPDIDAILDVHLRGAFFTMLPAFKWMRANEVRGRLLLTTSASGLYGNFGQANYAAAKLGVVGLMRVLSIEGAKYDITANAIAPAATTRLTVGAEGADDDPMSPRKVAPLALALCHLDNSVTGETFVAGGGKFSRTWLALGQGWSPEADEFTPEAVLAHLAQIRSTDEWFEPTSAMGLADWFTAPSDAPPSPSAAHGAS
jgi:NAD(P)-dependent dehydrogenase (short-subunit alcohol dehydrogenase family)